MATLLHLSFFSIVECLACPVLLSFLCTSIPLILCKDNHEHLSEIMDQEKAFAQCGMKQDD